MNPALSQLLAYLTGQDKDLGRFFTAIHDTLGLILASFFPTVQRIASGPTTLDPETLKTVFMLALKYLTIVASGLASGKSKFAIFLELLRG